VKIADIWMNFPEGARDPRHAYDDPAARQDFLIPDLQDGDFGRRQCGTHATTEATVQPRYSGEVVLLFSLDPICA